MRGSTWWARVALEDPQHDRPSPSLVVTEGPLPAVSTMLGGRRCHPRDRRTVEVDARARVAIGRGWPKTRSRPRPSPLRASRLTSRPTPPRCTASWLDLTYRQFQLLHFFATHPSRSSPAEQLLSQVWGYDYFGGGTCTVDVHVRCLRAKNLVISSSSSAPPATSATASTCTRHAPAPGTSRAHGRITRRQRSFTRSPSHLAMMSG